MVGLCFGSFCQIWELILWNLDSRWKRDYSNIRKRYTMVTEPVLHTLSEYKSIAGTRSNYCYMLKPGNDYLMFRRYLCRSCENCRLMLTDPFTGSVKCSREEKCGKWKKGKYVKKPKKEWKLMTWWLTQTFESFIFFVLSDLTNSRFESYNYTKKICFFFWTIFGTGHLGGGGHMLIYTLK